MKKIILTYYFIWFQAHKESRYAHQFDNYWCHALLQVCLTTILCLLLFTFLIDITLSVNIIKLTNSFVFLLLYVLLPFIAMYYLIFNFYGVVKDSDSPSRFGIQITKKKKIFAWVIYFGCLLLVCSFIYFQQALKSLV